MRVGLVCPYSLTLPGGVQGQVLGLAAALRSLGVEARVLGPCDGPQPDAAVTPLGESVPMAANGSMAAIAPDPASTLRTIRALRDEAFDVVHLHEPLVPGPALTSLLFSDSPLVGTFHRSGRSSWYRRAAPLARWVANHLDVRAAVSEEARRTAEEALGGSYEVVFNGIDFDAYRRAEPWPARGPTILFVGRHEPRKGLGVLLEAMVADEVVGLGPTVRLWVAGAGPESDRLRAATSGDPRIEWLGSIGEEEKRRRMRAADVFCAPSLHGESFGVVLLEGLAGEAVVVASDLPGYRNVVRGGRDAILVPPGEPKALASALAAALSGRADAQELAAAGRSRAEEFSMTHLAERYMQIYDRLVVPVRAHRSR
ncbi:MAG: glycosyltransferase family 4 protein [Acidimicrobiales bacterium]